MVILAEKQLQRAVADRRELLITSLYRMGKYTYNGKPLESLSLVDLENIHINEKCRMTTIKQIQGELI